jgi:hypothetical protein
MLDRLIEARGQPESVRSDNGPEFTSRRMLGWAEERKITLVHIQPGRPMQNGHVESFHDRLREECLNVSWFRTLSDVRRTVDRWRLDYQGGDYRIVSAHRGDKLVGLSILRNGRPEGVPSIALMDLMTLESESAVLSILVDG